MPNVDKADCMRNDNYKAINWGYCSQASGHHCTIRRRFDRHMVSPVVGFFCKWTEMRPAKQYVICTTLMNHIRRDAR